MSQLAPMVRDIVAELPAPMLDVVNTYLDVQVKPTLDHEDRARGCTDDLEAYFYGVTLEGFEEEDEGEPPDAEEYGGTIVLLEDKISPATPQHVAAVLCHEIGHFLGYSEEELVYSFELGDECSDSD